MTHLLQQAPDIEARLHYVFKDKTLLILAFVHCSFINENRQFMESHNERLEFLGDSVLGLLMADYLFRQLPDTPEGELSHLRSRLVEASSCVRYVQKIAIAPYMLLGKGERHNDGRGRESILADLFEAVIGAIYLDGGLEATREFIFHHFSSEIEELLQAPTQNWKALLQDYSQRTYRETPRYELVSESGPDHSKTFIIAVRVQEHELGRGSGSSKKEAQQAAAADACTRLEIPHG